MAQEGYQDRAYIYASSSSLDDLKSWASKMRTKSEKKGINYQGPHPLEPKEVGGITFYTRAFEVTLTDKSREILDTELPDEVYMEMSLGKNISPDVEDIIPDEKLHEAGEVDENSADSQEDEEASEVETLSQESEIEASESGESQTSTELSGSEQEPNLTELREQANEAAVEEVPESATTSSQTKQQYSRASEVRDYVMARADGECEGCEEPAPFTSKTGEPYLHAHHVHELSNGGSDTPDTVIALCPNCHYRVHHGEDGEEYNQELRETLNDIE